MKIAVIGTGYVGLVSGACLAEIGHHVICIDSDTEKIDKLSNNIIPIYEPELDTIIYDNVNGFGKGKLEFSTNLKDYIKDVDAVMIAVGTPMSENGSTDYKYIYSAADDIACGINETGRQDDLLVIVKSTVPAGTNDKVKERILSQLTIDCVIHMASNPEFLREGSAVKDFLVPDRIVIGYSDQYAKNLMTDLYLTETGNEFFADKLFFTNNIKSAELIKYASNCMLMTKVIFVDLIAKYCEKIGADIESVTLGMGLDKRIGNKFLKPGPGTSGSCFVKDCKSLIYEFQEAGISNTLLNGVDYENYLMYYWPAQKLINEALKDKEINHQLTIGILGTAFKPETDDVRYSASLYNTIFFLSKGWIVKHYDPQATENFVKSLPNYLEDINLPENIPDTSLKDNVISCNTPEQIFENADVVILMTDWKEFAELDVEYLKDKMTGNIFIDARNQFNGSTMRKYGYEYYGIGKPTKIAE